MKTIEDVELTRVNSDKYGNPRYVVHFFALLNDEEIVKIRKEVREFNEKYNQYKSSTEDLYRFALNKSRAIGGKKFHNKQFGGGIVFCGVFNENKLKQAIIEIANNQPFNTEF